VDLGDVSCDIRDGLGDLCCCLGATGAGADNGARSLCLCSGDDRRGSVPLIDKVSPCERPSDCGSESEPLSSDADLVDLRGLRSWYLTGLVLPSSLPSGVASRLDVDGDGDGDGDGDEDADLVDRRGPRSNR
jgi:hypothetical protein